ncbi:MAG: ATP-binding protein [Sarcina sp.]
MMNDFSFINFVFEKKLNIILKIFVMNCLGIFIYSKGVGIKDIFIIACVVIGTDLILNFVVYKNRKNYLTYLNKTVNNLDKKYLLSECIDTPEFLEDKVYYDIFKKTSKSMLEDFSKVKRERSDYKDYIEKWVHEIKTPISAIKLISENNKGQVSSEILSEVSSVESYIEQALFYARSETLEKDYLVKEISLTECINKVIIKSRRQFILNNVSVKVLDKDLFVYSDEKWLEFIITQIVNNSIKYKKDNQQSIEFKVLEVKNGVRLSIKDYGQGIKSEDIERVFEKGFTGAKGRGNNNSTGIGLYLVKKLSDKLGIIINIDTNFNVYTNVDIIFPKGEFASNDIFE